MNVICIQSNIGVPNLRVEGDCVGMSRSGSLFIVIQVLYECTPLLSEVLLSRVRLEPGLLSYPLPFLPFLLY